MIFKRLHIPIALSLLVASLPVSALVLDIFPSADLNANAPALAAFERAAAQWEAVITTDVTVKLDGDVSNFGTGSETTIGQTSTILLQAPHDDVVGQMQLDTDNPILAFLPSAAQFSANLQIGDSNDGNIIGTQANLQALGYTGFTDPAGSISFNSAFAFDYDNSDGVTGGTMDFETVALHEIGHLLGFISIVDIYDQNPPGAAGPTVLDLFRFSDSDMPGSETEFRDKARELRPGEAASFTDGETVIPMSTGSFGGDGRQASHWKDNLGLGILDPTLAYGEIGSINANDLLAFDLIGWDVVKAPVVAAVPEPSITLILLQSMVIVALTYRRRL